MVWYAKFWVKISLLAVAVGLVVGGTYAYYRLTQPVTGPRVSVTSEPLEFSMELDKSDFQYGENMTIKFCLKNIGNETITFWNHQPPSWPDGYRESVYFNAYVYGSFGPEVHFGFRVLDTNGTEILELDGGVLAYSCQVTIDPNGWVEQTIILDYYSSEWAGVYNWLQIPRGTYQIRGVFRHTLADPPTYTLETPAVTFTIK